MRRKMMKEDPGVSKAQAWGCPMHPKKYSRRLKRLSLGMPPCIPFSINNHQFVLLHAIFLSLHMLCTMLGVSHSLPFQFVLVLLAVHNKLDPSLHCLGEKHAPLHPRTQHRFSCLSLIVCSLSFHSYCHAQLLVSCLSF